MYRTTAAPVALARREAPGRALVWLVTLVTLGSGVANLYSVASPPAHAHPALLRDVFPLEFFHYPRSFTLLIGLALVISAANIYRRKRRAFWIVLGLAALSAVLHLLKGHNGEQALFALLLFGVLVGARRSFTVRSSTPDWRASLLRLAVAALAAFGYGVAGFWLLDRREFGLNFDWSDSIHRTLLYLALVGDPQLVPQTRYAAWFLDSLSVLTFTIIGYAGFALFPPIVYRFRTLPHERELAREILARHGRSALDYFKLWPDKSYFFGPSGNCFIAYRVGGNFAIALGDPVGPEAEIAATIGAFARFCGDQGWGLAFHQTLPDFLFVYRQLGFKKLKVGDEAVVDLAGFNLGGKAMRNFRHKIAQFEKQGIRACYYDAPVADETLAQLRAVSDEWLRIPGRRERTFALGQFEPDYVRTTPVMTVEDAAGRVLAFVNLVPSYRPGEGAIDLMRHRAEGPNGVMDYLFVKLIRHFQEQGLARFNLGMAPMAGFQEREGASAGERAVHLFFQHMNFLFSFSGLKHYKAKFATSWEPRYVVYRHALDLPKLGLALSKVSEFSRSAYDWYRPATVRERPLTPEAAPRGSRDGTWCRP